MSFNLNSPIINFYRIPNKNSHVFRTVTSIKIKTFNKIAILSVKVLKNFLPKVKF